MATFKAPSVRLGQRNQLEVVAIDSQLWLFVNGEFVGTFADTMLVDGNIAPTVNVLRLEEAIYLFDTFVIKVPS